jgi:hypothetical protein
LKSDGDCCLAHAIPTQDLAQDGFTHVLQYWHLKSINVHDIHQKLHILQEHELKHDIHLKPDGDCYPAHAIPTQDFGQNGFTYGLQY